jgi:2-(1,2-epoxy-1,2-dihydrophenyl)acetyl-CoA isomerase
VTALFEGCHGLRVTAGSDGCLRLVLDRIESRNALDDEMVATMISCVADAERDEQVRAILLSGAGDHFCGGFDIVSRNAAAHDRRPRVGSIQRRLPSQAHRLITLMVSVQVPIVCAVQGWAAGIGVQLAAAADFTVAATDACFWEPFIDRGFTPDSGATWLLPRLVGPVRARELLLLGRRLSGDEAVNWGLIHKAVPSDDVAAESERLVSQLAGGPTVALGLTKWLLHRGSSTSLDEHLRDEALGLEISSRSEDFREGLNAFKERRPPRFEGR